MLVSFVWGRADRHSRHRASQHILTLPKCFGGLGLIDISMQAMALYLRAYLFTFEPGYHLLQHHVRDISSQTSLRRYGFASLAPILENKCCNMSNLSPVMVNMLKA